MPLVSTISSCFLVASRELECPRTLSEPAAMSSPSPYLCALKERPCPACQGEVGQELVRQRLGATGVCVCMGVQASRVYSFKFSSDTH